MSQQLYLFYSVSKLFFPLLSFFFSSPTPTPRAQYRQRQRYIFLLSACAQLPLVSAYMGGKQTQKFNSERYLIIFLLLLTLSLGYFSIDF